VIEFRMRYQLRALRVVLIIRTDVSRDSERRATG
jgi:hypothetical protein